MAFAVADYKYDCCIASHRYHSRPRPEPATVGFVTYYLLSEDRLEKIDHASPKGTAGCSRILSLGNLGKIGVPMPSVAVQQSFVRLRTAIAALKAIHTDIRKANAALIPATLDGTFATGVRSTS